MESQFFMSSLKNLWNAHKINPAKETDVSEVVEQLRGPDLMQKDTPSPLLEPLKEPHITSGTTALDPIPEETMPLD